jgi:hypothetical protein
MPLLPSEVKRERYSYGSGGNYSKIHFLSQLATLRKEGAEATRGHFTRPVHFRLTYGRGYFISDRRRKKKIQVSSAGGWEDLIQMYLRLLPHRS